MNTHHCAGKLDKATATMNRNDAAMLELIALTNVPETTGCPEDLAKLKLLRDVPLEGEEEIMWAIQQDDTPSTRQVLPEWISGPVSRQLMRWAREAHAWDIKMARRSDGELAPAQRKKFEQWKEHTQEKYMFFNKKHRQQVLHTIDPASLQRVQKEVFVILKPDTDASKLKLQAGNGDSRQLVALKGIPVREADAPDFLSAAILDLSLVPAEPADLEEVVEEEKEQEDNPSDLEQMEMERAEKEDADLELLLMTEDEKEISEELPRHKRIKTFMHRDAYQTLARHNLTDIPTSVTGICIGCHSTTRCWQGFVPEVHQGLSFSWGGTTGRSEIEALVQCLKGILNAYIDRFPRESIWKLSFLKSRVHFLVVYI